MKITPKDTSFYDLFTTSAKHLVEGAETLSKIVDSDGEEQKQLAEQMRQIEHQGDEATHTILNRINKTFITPFDRDDIYHLAAALDDCLDFMDEASDFIVLYKINKLPKKMQKQVAILQEMAKLTLEAMPKLRTLDKLDSFCVEINELENKGDKAYRSLLANLFEDSKDVVHIMKMRDLMEALENSADAFERVANTVETIIVKEG